MCGEVDASELLLLGLPPAHLQQTVHVQESHLRGSAGNKDGHSTLLGVGDYFLLLHFIINVSGWSRHQREWKGRILLIPLLCNVGILHLWRCRSHLAPSTLYKWQHVGALVHALYF